MKARGVFDAELWGRTIGSLMLPRSSLMAESFFTSPFPIEWRASRASSRCSGMWIAMKGAELVERFGERQRLAAERFPFRRARRSSFRVNSMLCASSFARSSVDADDSDPVPVFEKFGSGLKR